MSAPRFVECKCGHTRALHPERLEEACTFSGCGCEEYRPITLDRLQPASVGVSAAAPRLSVEELLASAKGSGSKRLAKAAEKIDGLVRVLRDQLREDAANAAIRKEAAELESRLRDLRAQLRGESATATPKPQSGPPRGEYACGEDGCDYVSPTAQGRSAHIRFNHTARAAS